MLLARAHAENTLKKSNDVPWLQKCWLQQANSHEMAARLLRVFTSRQKNKKHMPCPCQELVVELTGKTKMLQFACSTWKQQHAAGSCPCQSNLRTPNGVP